METQVAVQETKAVSLANTMDDLGISAQDLVIPKLLLMQNTSEMVGDGAAKSCDVVNSQTLQVIGGLTQPIEIVPLKVYKTWRVYSLAGKQPEFIRQEAVTAANINLPWDDMEDGVPIRRDLCMNYFVLLMSEVTKGEAFPCVVSFKRTSMQAGKQLATHLFKMMKLNKPAYSQSIQLKVSKQKTDTNTYGVFEIGAAKPLAAEHQAIAESWFKELATITYKIDDKDDVPAAQVATVAPEIVQQDSKMKF